MRTRDHHVAEINRPRCRVARCLPPLPSCRCSPLSFEHSVGGWGNRSEGGRGLRLGPAAWTRSPCVKGRPRCGTPAVIDLIHTLRPWCRAVLGVSTGGVSDEIGSTRVWSGYSRVYDPIPLYGLHFLAYLCYRGTPCPACPRSVGCGSFAATL